MANPFAPPAIDFSGLANLADPIINALKERQAAALLQEWAGAALGGAQAPTRAQQLLALDPANVAPAAPKLPAFAAAQGTPDTSKITGLIQSAAAQHGVDPAVLTRVAQIESGLNPSARNPNSSAAGLFQFIRPTAQQYGLTNPMDATASADAGARLMADNRQALRNALGRDPTPGELYLAHQQGAGGAVKLLSNPNARAADLVGAEAVRLNGGTPNMTAAQFASLWDRKVGMGGADTPAPGAREAQFRVPGASDAPATAGVLPQQREVLMRMLANPQTRAAAMAQITELSKQGFDFQVVGDQLVRLDKRRGTAVVVPGIEKPTQWQTFKTDDGRQVAWNPQTLETAMLDKGGGGWRPMTAAEKSSFGIPDDTGAAMGPGGKPQTLPGTARTQLSVDTKGATALATKRSEQFAKMIEEGEAAQSALSDIGQLRDLSRNLGNQGQMAAIKARLGPYAEALDIDIAGLSDIQAYESIISRLAPTMRPPGSGATSDFEMRQYLNALPGLIRNPQAREMVLDTMQATAEYNAKRGEIASRLAADEIDRKTAEKELRELKKPLEIYREFRKNNPTIVRDALKAKDQPTAGAPSAQNPPRRVSREEYEKLPSGTPFIAADDPKGSVRVKP